MARPALEQAVGFAPAANARVSVVEVGDGPREEVDEEPEPVRKTDGARRRARRGPSCVFRRTLSSLSSQSVLVLAEENESPRGQAAAHLFREMNDRSHSHVRTDTFRFKCAFNFPRVEWNGTTA